MRILHTVAGLWRGTGGPVASITSLCRELARRGHEVSLLTGQGELHPDVLAIEGAVRVRTEPLGPYALAHCSLRFRSACRAESGRADVVHDHGVWLFTNWASAWAALERGRPLVRSPRGMLSPWSLSRSAARKRLLWLLVERRLFATSGVVHATSLLESEELRALGVPSRVEVISNGIDTDGEFAATRIDLLRAALKPTATARRRIVFLSRLHPKKGLDILRHAWESLPLEPPAELVIAGDGAADVVDGMNRWVTTQRGHPVRYLGLVEGENKLRLLVSAWAFVLPSRSENYSMSVAEALACGVPVVTTTATPWGEIETLGCGLVVEPRATEFAGAVGQILTLHDDERRAMGSRARRLVEERHSLRATGARFEALYDELANSHGVGRGY